MLVMTDVSNLFVIPLPNPFNGKSPPGGKLKKKKKKYSLLQKRRYEVMISKIP